MTRAELDAAVDRVLRYRPKPKSESAKKRLRKQRKFQQEHSSK